jgi:hypothetical protein
MPICAMAQYLQRCRPAQRSGRQRPKPAWCCPRFWQQEKNCIASIAPIAMAARDRDRHQPIRAGRQPWADDGADRQPYPHRAQWRLCAGHGGNPRPYSMPPFGPVLNDLEVAQILTYVRSSWGNQAEPVSASEVNQYRSVPLD